MKLCIHLSGNWNSKAEQLASSADMHICLSPISKSKTNLEWVPLDIQTKTTKEKLSKAVIECLGPIPRDAYCHHISNDYVDYALAPIAASIQAIIKLVKDYKVSQISIWTARTTLDHAPLYGIQNTEDTRGSKHLQGAYIAKILEKSELGVPVSFNKLTGDIFCSKLIRKAIITLVSIILVLVSAIKLLKNGFSSHSIIKNSIVFLARSPAQRVHVDRMMREIKNSQALFIPQFSINFFRGNESCKIGRERIIYPTAKAIFLALIATLKIKNGYENIKTEVNYGGVVIPVTRKGIETEARMMPLYEYYEKILFNTVRTLDIKKIINFEIKGGFAGSEARAIMQSNVSHETIQTVLTQKGIMPIFPFSKTFYADSETSQKAIQDNGIIKFGKTVYTGIPYGRSIEPTAVAEIRSAVFYSQPYENAKTLDLLENLANYSIDNNISLAIRLHPRDGIENYNGLSLRSKTAITFLQGGSLESSILNSDVGITRTSSVAKDILVLGKPLVLCLWSDLDQSLEADYINFKLGNAYIAKNIGELTSCLSAPEHLHDTAESLKRMIYGERNFDDLVRSLEQ